MKILNVTEKIDENKLEEIAKEIKNGKLCLFPTETVYGIGTNGLDEKAVEKIYKVKNRNRNNPINLLVSDFAMIEKITQNILPLEYKLMEAFFPGPFTIILNKKDIVPNIVAANSDFVGIRMPNGIIAKKLVELAGVPIAAPSANISGCLSGTNLNDIIDEFSESIDFAIDGGESKIGMESTIVRVVNNVPHILRPGSITPKQIMAISKKVVLEKPKNDLLPSSNLKHYQLNIPSCLIYYKDNQKIVNKIDEISNNFKNPVVICCTENSHFYTNKNVMSIASRNDLENYSKNLFSYLRKAASLHPDIILIEGVEEVELGIAIMNRLKNICNELYIEQN